MKTKALVFVLLMSAASATAYAQYQIQFNSEAARALHLGGVTRRGNWCSRAEAEAYWKQQSKFERDNSRIVGSDCAKKNPASRSSQPSRGRRAQGESTTTPTSGNIDKVDTKEFEREKNDVLLRLKGRTIEGSSFDGDNKDLLGRLKGGASAGGDEAAIARAEFEKMSPTTIANERKLIAERLAMPNPWCESYTRSLKIKAPPLPPKMFSQLQPGDVLLIAPDDLTGYGIWLADMLTSLEGTSRASHTAIYLKEVNGVRFFLDNLPKEGPRIKTEDQMIEKYGARYIDIAQPVLPFDANKLWGAARELEIKQIAAVKEKADNLIDTTNYGLFGDDNLVCSEASRWVLLKAGLKTADTESPFKWFLNISYGPANFYSDTTNFLITPLGNRRGISDQK